MPVKTLALNMCVRVRSYRDLVLHTVIVALLQQKSMRQGTCVAH